MKSEPHKIKLDTAPHGEAELQATFNNKEEHQTKTQLAMHP